MLACDAVSPKRGIVAQTKKPITIAPIRPNVGLTAAYQAKLDALIDEMSASLTYWLKAAYRANEPEMAQDASPARALQAAFRKLARRWQKRFDEAAPELAEYFAKAAKDRTDYALKSALKKSGFTVEFKLTAQVNDVVQATIAENVALIKSIASENLTQVEGMLMRSVTAGRDLGSMAKELQERLGVTKKRAALISRDQNNKMSANITRARQKELGITRALWIHSSAGKHPRASHVNASGKPYDIDKGMYLDGEWVWPGTAINCRCVARSIIPGLD